MRVEGIGCRVQFSESSSLPSTPGTAAALCTPGFVEMGLGSRVEGVGFTV